jgi:hypothetical protein
MADNNLDDLFAQSILDQLSRSTLNETSANIVPNGFDIPNISYSDYGLEKDNPFIALKNSKITEEQAIAIIHKVSEFTGITQALETIYKAKVGRGISRKDACVATVDVLAGFLAQQV